MNITQELKMEHQTILTINRQMQRLAFVSYQISDDRYFNLLARYVSFIENFVDYYHHFKEEEILFEALNLPGMMEGRSAVPELIHEHDIARDALNMINISLKRLDRQLAKQGVESYAGIMAQHIAKEDEVLYPLAETLMNDQIKQQILRFYTDIELSVHKGHLWQTQIKFSQDLDSALVSAQSCLH